MWSRASFFGNLFFSGNANEPRDCFVCSKKSFLFFLTEIRTMESIHLEKWFEFWKSGTLFVPYGTLTMYHENRGERLTFTSLRTHNRIR